MSDPPASPKPCGHEGVDCNCECTPRKPLDVNKYATKKTIAQGMLDIALLTANASQLKYILQVGHNHEFYTLMLTLISISMILQVLIGLLLLSLNLMRDCRLHLAEFHKSADYINLTVTGISVAITSINLLISAFDPTLTRFVSSVLTLGLTTILARADFLKNSKAAFAVNQAAMACALLSMVFDVIKMSFGLDPALSVQDFVIQAIVAIYLGTALNLNKESDEDQANTINNVVLAINVLITAVNVLISSFDMRETETFS